jgi:hypothetical protein
MMGSCLHSTPAAATAATTATTAATAATSSSACVSYDCTWLLLLGLQQVEDVLVVLLCRCCCNTRLTLSINSQEGVLQTEATAHSVYVPVTMLSMSLPLALYTMLTGRGVHSHNQPKKNIYNQLHLHTQSLGLR